MIIEINDKYDERLEAISDAGGTSVDEVIEGAVQAFIILHMLPYGDQKVIKDIMNKTCNNFELKEPK